MARLHNRENLMNYNELIQLYFERSTAMQAYWNLYVVIVGGLLALSSLRKQPAAITTLIVSILFALFAYENLDAMYDTTRQRFATIQAVKEFDGKSAEIPALEGSLALGQFRHHGVGISLENFIAGAGIHEGAS